MSARQRSMAARFGARLVAQIVAVAHKGVHGAHGAALFAESSRKE